MPTETFSYRYRPLRIGFLVRPGSLEDVTRAAGVNTLLWGGIHNPIMPVAEDLDALDQFIHDYSLDVLYPVAKHEVIDRYMERHPSLRAPEHHANNIFYEDWKTKKLILAYLDVTRVFDLLWEEHFKSKPDGFLSNASVVEWAAEDELRYMLAMKFGYYATDWNLRDDYRSLFLKALRATEIRIEASGSLPQTLATRTSPLDLTATRLDAYGPGGIDAGLFVGDPTSFEDLVTFWNLRAAGGRLEFLPLGAQPRIGDYAKAVGEELLKLKLDYLPVYHRQENEAPVHEVAGLLPESLRPSLRRCDENLTFSLTFSLQWDFASASVDTSRGRHSVTLGLPPRGFLPERRRRARSQVMSVSLEPMGGFSYPDHTLRVPYLPALNEFYSREICFNPWVLRVEPEGIRAVIDTTDHALTLRPLGHQPLMTKLFQHAGLAAELSQPGRIARRIIEKVDDIEGCRVFKIPGVRRVLQELSPDDSATRGRVTDLIWDEGRFKKFEDLYIEAREEPHLRPDAVMDFLLRNDFLRAGLYLECRHCRLNSWLSLKELDDSWTCNFCGDENQTSLQLRDRGNWRFRKSGLFAKDNNQEGALPVVLSLLTLKRVMERSLYTTSLKVTGPGIDSELDLAFLEFGRQGEFALAIGEAKSQGGEIDQDDVDKLEAVRLKLEAAGIMCYLVFAKTADAFRADEIQLFKNLRDARIPVILLTNRELEPYSPYWEREEDEVAQKYALSLEDMWMNSEKAYLS